MTIMNSDSQARWIGGAALEKRLEEAEVELAKARASGDTAELNLHVKKVIFRGVTTEKCSFCVGADVFR